MLVGDLSILNHTGRVAFISGLVMEILALIAVVLRFATKLKTRLGFTLDDFLLLSGFAAFIAWFGVQVWGLISGGGGRNIQDPGFDFAQFSVFLEALYILEPIYGLSVTLVKLSILSFLHRVFYNNSKSIVIYSLYTISIVWWIVYTITTCLNCRPVQKFWDPTIDGHCYNYAEFFLGIEIVDILINFSILCAPVGVIWRLNLPINKKASACVLFVFGGFVCVTGVIRLALTYIPGSDFISFSAALLWTNIHIGTAIICACLPLYAPILVGIVHVVRTSLSGVSQLLHSMRRGGSTRAYSKDGSEIERGEGGNYWYASAKGPASDSDVHLDPFSDRHGERVDSAIRVQTTISVR